jgi:hypothetical protein
MWYQNTSCGFVGLAPTIRKWIFLKDPCSAKSISENRIVQDFDSEFTVELARQENKHFAGRAP